MIIFKIHDPYNGILTYTFQDESYGKSGNTDFGISNFIAAMKKQYHGHHEDIYMTVMNEQGEYLDKNTGNYIIPVNMNQVRILISGAR